MKQIKSLDKLKVGNCVLIRSIFLEKMSTIDNDIENTDSVAVVVYKNKKNLSWFIFIIESINNT